MKFRDWFGLDSPKPQGEPVIWIHAVSVGEVKAAKPLVEIIRRELPNAFLLITTITATGQEEARRSLPQANAYRFFPLDLPWIQKRWVNTLKPRLLLLIEGDLWFNHLKAVRNIGGKTALVSGKISARSARRYSYFPWIAKKLYGRLDLFLVQNQEHADRFARILGYTPQIGGNLKLDAKPIPIDKTQLPQDFPFPIAVTCTHAPEEEELLDALQSLPATLFLAPRHPERFNEVAKLLEKKQIPYIRWSDIANKRGGERVVLVDSIGQLPTIYSLCQAAIVGGSYSSKLGGHNVLEPCLYGLPVFFGPHMHQQTELARRALHSGAGRQVPSSLLAQSLTGDLTSMRQAAHSLFSEPIAEKNWEILRLAISK
jgi:3-deoxy-D-manno-octulosonic-acid transferase